MSLYDIKELLVFVFIPLVALILLGLFVKKKMDEPKWTDQHEIRFLEEENERLQKEIETLKSAHQR